MKNSPNNASLATYALLLAGTIGGLASFASKIALRELPPLTILFIRVTIMILVLAPLLGKRIKDLWAYRRNIILLGFLWAGNVLFFIIGIQYTTTIASQILYTAVPLIVLIISVVLGQERVRRSMVVGILVGTLGVLTIIFRPDEGLNLGSLQGNFLILIATVSWSFYLTFSKRLSENISPLGLIVGSSIVTWLITGLSMILLEGFSGISRLSSLTPTGLGALLYVALGVGVAMMFLYQWGIKHGSAIVAGTMQYITVVVTPVAGVLFLGEQLTPQLLIGASCVVFGVFLTSTLPLVKKTLLR